GQQPPRDNPAPPSAAIAAAAKIVGRVTDESGQPLRKARVTIVRVMPLAGQVPFGPGFGPPPPRPNDESPPPVAFTDNDGAFALTGLDAGHYTLSVRKAGYVPTTYGARHSGEPSIGIDLEDGGRATVTVRMPRSAGISGRIVDQYGEPMEGV